MDPIRSWKKKHFFSTNQKANMQSATLSPRFMPKDWAEYLLVEATYACVPTTKLERIFIKWIKMEEGSGVSFLE